MTEENNDISGVLDLYSDPRTPEELKRRMAAHYAKNIDDKISRQNGSCRLLKYFVIVCWIAAFIFLIYYIKIS